MKWIIFVLKRNIHNLKTLSVLVFGLKIQEVFKEYSSTKN